MDNIQLCYIDNEINKIDKMKQGDVIYKNGMELLVVLSYDHNEPCKGCFFYKNKACGSEKLIACGVGAPHKRYRIWFIASDCSDARVEGLRQGREDKIHGFEFTSQTRDKIRRLITDTSGLRSHRFLYDKEDDKKQRSTENRLFKKYACRDWDGRGSTQWKSFPTQSPICRGNDGLPFNVDNLTIPYGKWRKESIKAYGNAIVPLIAVKIFEMINKIEGYEQQTTL